MEKVEAVVRSIKKHMEVWDSENPEPRGFYREEAIDSLFMDWLRNDASNYEDELLGSIVKRLVTELEGI